MHTPEFRPGFRIGPFDVLILISGAVASAMLSRQSWALGFVIAFVTGHFFLFCNVFRISRPLELVWAITFVTLAKLTVRTGQPGWPVTSGVAIGVAIAAIVLEMRKPSYHGVFWRKINPNLRSWWDEQQARG